MVDTSTAGNPHYYASYQLSDGSLINVEVLDTAGQERFRALNTSYYRNADCCVLVYDISSKSSFDECNKYYCNKIKEKCQKGIPVILLGNKTDLEAERKVSLEEASNFALKNNYMHMETSCYYNKNVSSAFEYIIEITNREMRKGKKKKSNIKIKKDNVNNQKKASSCC